MNPKMVYLTPDELEDIRFALARVADHDEELADKYKSDLAGLLLAQRDRFRALAKKISG